MNVVIGKWATAIRQIVDAASQITGVAPYVDGALVPPVVPLLCVPGKYERCIYTYCDPRDTTATVALDGGVFVFGESAREAYSVRITEIHVVCGVGSVVDVYITDADGSFPRKILDAVSGNGVRHLPSMAYVLAGQKLRVLETVSGVPAVGNKTVTVYAQQEGRV